MYYRTIILLLVLTGVANAASTANGIPDCVDISFANTVCWDSANSTLRFWNGSSRQSATKSVPSTLANCGTCNVALEGAFCTQTDSAAACVAGVTAAAGGAIHCALYCNGSLWKRIGQ